MPRYRVRNDLLNENRIAIAHSPDLKAKLRRAKKALKERRMRANAKN